MQKLVGRTTAPEQRLRSALHRAGLRFRKEVRVLDGVRTADVVFTRAKLCIFIDGCFWHGCPQHFRVPKSNTAWWDEKIKDNMERDRRQTNLLGGAGWTVMRIWEHEIKGDLEPLIKQVQIVIQATKTVKA